MMTSITTVLYVLFCAAVLPFWDIQQHLGGRSIPFVLASCLFAVYAVISGVSIPVDGITIAAGCLAGWLAASLIWTDSKQSAQELFDFLACLVLFIAARTIPLPLAALGIFATGCIFAAMQVYRMCFRREMTYEDKFFILGNDNHNGAFLMFQLFAGIWLTVNMSVWFVPFVWLVGLGLIMTRCKAALIGAIVSGMVCLAVYGQWTGFILIASIVVITAGTVYILLGKEKILAHFWTGFARALLCLSAIAMIIKKPFAGWGLNMFRKERSRFNASIVKTPAGRYLLSKVFEGSARNRSHRVHNDHLEIIVETGLIGYGLFVLLFARTLPALDPVMTAGFIAFAINALFFFPMREVHTAAPFWCVMGAATGGAVTPLSLSFIPAAFIVAVAGAITLQVCKRVMAMRFYNMACNKDTDVQTKQKHIDIALRYDPYNNGYLSDAAFLWSNTDPIKSFQYCSRALHVNDGDRVLSGQYNQYALALFNAGDLAVIDWAERNALELDPDFEQAKIIRGIIAQRKQKTRREAGTEKIDTNGSQAHA